MLYFASSVNFPLDTMPRKPKPRTITCCPPSVYFKPAGIPVRDLEEIPLAADELEALKLCDMDMLYREEAALRMGISRQTLDRVVRSARKKVAGALVHGMALRIGS